METPTVNSLSASPQFKGQVLKQIYRVWLWRKFLPILVIEVAVLSFIIYELAQAVFLQRVLENAMNVFFQNPPHIFSFFISAFVVTGFATKVLVIAVIGALVFAIRHITQGFLRFILVRENYFSKVSNNTDKK
ncbi:MAG: hypothetical protein U1A25_02465 [Candidatus Sungbacteria bacterium]|nr:hypothetical protein [bacterium]MDZ4260504.1 hypothetical protein [Candidatus Sungbacteria bacterium]